MTNFTVPLYNYTPSGDGKIRGAYESGIAELTGTISIVGVPEVSTQLSSTSSALAREPASLGVASYQWYWDTDAAIVGATSVTYTPVSGDIGYGLYVIHSGTDDWGNAWSYQAPTTASVSDSGDVTAPVLSTPTSASTGATTGSGSISTDEGNGVLYWVTTTSGTAPSVAQIQLGQDNSGTVAADAGTPTVMATGTQNISSSSLVVSTVYYNHFQHKDEAGNDSTVSTSASFTTVAVSTVTYWVATTGSDAGGAADGLSSGNAFATPDKAAAVILADNTTAGEITTPVTVNIEAGTYLVTNAVQGADFFGVPIGIQLLASSGTAANRLTYQAAPGDEGLVILDGAEANLVFHLGGNMNYLTIQNLHIKNSRHSGIVGRPTANRVATEENSMSGIHIIDNFIENTIQPTGENVNTNINAIRLDYSKDCIITGNKIDGVVLVDAPTNGKTACIECYGTWNLLVQNNELANANNGVTLKNHTLEYDDPLLVNRIYHTPEMVATENVIHDIYFHAFNIITNANNGWESGNCDMNHNLLYDIRGNGLNMSMADSLYNSQNMQFNYNTVVKLAGAGYGTGLAVDSGDNYKQKGNIFSGYSTRNTYVIRDEVSVSGNNHIPTMTESDFNVFDTTFSVVLDHIGTESTTYTTLTGGGAADITAALIADATVTLGVDNPENSSTTDTAANLFTDPATNDYSNKVGSNAIDLITTGQSAGYDNLGTETIGIPSGTWTKTA